jgi:hypothetical protein
MTGDITVNATTMNWNSASTSAANMFTLSLGSGSAGNPYLDEDGENGVATLNIASQPVSNTTTFAPIPFITFDVTAGTPTLEINQIFAGTATAANCGGTPTVPESCTPPNGGNGSPFTFFNTEPASTIQSTAQWVFAGITTDGAFWRGNFSANFNVPYQTVLAELSVSPFSVTNGYSGTIVVQAQSFTPEPGPLGMAGFGLGLVMLWRVGVRRRRNRLG